MPFDVRLQVPEEAAGHSLLQCQGNPGGCLRKVRVRDCGDGGGPKSRPSAGPV